VDVGAAFRPGISLLQAQVEGLTALAAFHPVAQQGDLVATNSALHDSSIGRPVKPRINEEGHQRFHDLLAVRSKLVGAAGNDSEALQSEFAQAKDELRALLTPEPRKPNRLLASTERLLERALAKIPGYQKL
jgi:hypothetical protein